MAQLSNDIPLAPTQGRCSHGAKEVTLFILEIIHEGLQGIFRIVKYYLKGEKCKVDERLWLRNGPGKNLTESHLQVCVERRAIVGRTGSGWNLSIYCHLSSSSSLAVRQLFKYTVFNPPQHRPFTAAKTMT